MPDPIKPWHMGKYEPPPNTKSISYAHPRIQTFQDPNTGLVVVRLTAGDFYAQKNFPALTFPLELLAENTDTWMVDLILTKGIKELNDGLTFVVQEYAKHLAGDILKQRIKDGKE